MFSATGAPAPTPPSPPPPPRPSPKKASFEALPAELLLNIIRFLRINDYVKLALALYPTLQSHGLVPPLTVNIFHRIIRRQPPTPSFPTTMWRTLPDELNNQIMEYLEPADRLAFLFSHRELYWSYFPALSEGTKVRLWDMMKTRRKKK